MIIETKKLSSTKELLFFPKPLSIYGSFYHSREKSDNLAILKNIAEIDENAELLLTKDFLYINASSETVLSDLSALASAEISDAALSTAETAPFSYAAEKTAIILEAIVSPFLKLDGGDIKLISCANQTVQVCFLGRCHDCPYAERTLKERVEKNIMMYLPEIREVTLV